MTDALVSAATQPQFDSVLVKRWAQDVLCAAGLAPSDARITADLLLFSQIRGVISHGLSLLGPYVERIRDGGTNLVPVPRHKANGGVCVIDADDAIGSVCAMRASEAAADSARSNGIGMAVVRNANHIGALAFYVQGLAAQGLVAIMATNADPSMAPPEGGPPLLGSNPLAVAVPDPRAEGRIVLDMATTAVAHGRLVAALRQDQAIPEHWAVDSAGLPTTDPAEALKGALLPAAGYKGYGLAFMIDLLTAGLSGGQIGRDIVPLKASTDKPQGISVLVIAIDPEYCSGAEHLSLAVTALEDHVAAGAAAGKIPPVAPGVPESQRAMRSGRDVAVDLRLVEELSRLGKDVAVPWPFERSL